MSDVYERVREEEEERRRWHVNEVDDCMNRVAKTAYDGRYRERFYSIFSGLVVFDAERTLAGDFSRTFHKNRTEAVQTRYREVHCTRRRRGHVGGKCRSNDCSGMSDGKLLYFCWTLEY